MLILFLPADRNWDTMFLLFPSYSMSSVFRRHGSALVSIVLYQGILFWDIIVLVMFVLEGVCYISSFLFIGNTSNIECGAQETSGYPRVFFLLLFEYHWDHRH